MRQFKGDTNPVFNLGHDMTPDVDPKNMKILVDCVHTFSKRQVL
ncbi:Uroporphyrinogen III decarboxylase [bacterium endosymbiont of Bathymodiolus sp. 5 South]|jgi:uroporphyrinogen decarboxylase|nr:Uroporphyrinogen III decarboxylase [bacterium endosymbiont of Bathymodiolus sp. 5 South]VVH57791.1 Uroporphyrinogen III decarboxylase (EC [uncultured Gammaproteobacteria bacterium]